ncbi:hypothetical protein TNCV_1122811 [Trichonephila clavipes]|uniref:Uncharacterized protein n=1 Tax=Trichonephila clavipes TaxID=2585209 RepID=A0A8X6SPR1_TRICX|nr:hypothetical protein TNCV_1122811 [Trichonephila clavipes]
MSTEGLDYDFASICQAKIGAQSITSAGLSIGCLRRRPGFRKGPVKLDLTGSKSTSLDLTVLRGPVDLPRPGPE